jgi:brefeldin A-inhibited guanine nucleotide-exchange protein
VKKKMSKQEFLKNNRGINDGASLDDGYMSSLYDAIVSEAFKMEGHGSSASNSSNREVSFKSEAADILKSAASQLKAAKRRGSTSAYRSAPIAATVVGMLQVVWAPLLASFSVVFEENAYHVASDYDLETWFAGATTLGYAGYGLGFEPL